MKNSWISIEQELPENGLIVLCCDIYNTFVSLGRYLEDQHCFEIMNIECVEIDTQPTHWMLLPQLPS